MEKREQIGERVVRVRFGFQVEHGVRPGARMCQSRKICLPRASSNTIIS
jgi:hypothetical protein